MTDPRTKAFHDLWYNSGHQGGTWDAVTFLGVKTIKCPLDLWLYQEILHEVRPDLVIETGTSHGGSALYLASLLDMIGKGHVLTIDVIHRADFPQHRRLAYLTGDSAGLLVAKTVREASKDRKTLVILDSDHSERHVREELAIYAPLVSPGSYLIVEDTNVPDPYTHGPGPAEAVAAFLSSAEGSRFDPDARGEKFILTMNPGGVLRKRSP